MAFTFRKSSSPDTLNKAPSRRRFRHYGEIAMTGATAMAMFGPRRFRPYFQHLVTLVGVISTTINIFRPKS
ncbi:hypothetical protein GT348_07545 [Aristophania vespae]|uniref:Uncharacterized protein n=1 Tax=Aristophania vespae TaxID=2697033 RepID=A0A6P1NHU8_9PROT|nr:hypothetical protein [Aristophania vespae]QHI96110.1 hypothetical protein GT348_07545 [Aristophania vespae]UMM63879.1 hypothetical protein DM15PD_08570 [Aristophania vespae]